MEHARLDFKASSALMSSTFDCEQYTSLHSSASKGALAGLERSFWTAVCLETLEDERARDAFARLRAVASKAGDRALADEAEAGIARWIAKTKGKISRERRRKRSSS